MKFKLYFSIFILLSSPLFAKSSLQIGEKLKYNVYYNFMKGGESYMEVTDVDTIDGKELFHIKSITRSTGIVDLVFSINDRLESWIDPKTLFSYRFKKKIREGKYKKDYDVLFDYQDSLARSNSDTIAINPPIHDALSIFYYLREAELDTGKIFKVNNYDSDTLKHYNIKVTKIEKIKVPAGEFKCFKLEPYAEEGELFEKHKNKIVTYISQDSLRIPVKITSDANFGQLIMKLKQVQN